MHGSRLLARPTRAFGATLFELLVALAILGAVFGGAALVFRPDRAGDAARRVQALLLAARIDAVARGVPTAVVYRRGPAGESFALLRGAAGDRPAAVCSGGGLVRRERLPPGVRATPLRADLVWLPDGFGRGCDGSGVYNGTLRFESGDHGWAVRIAAAGRIRRERLP